MRHVSDLAVLEDMTSGELRTWVKKFLFTGDSFPLQMDDTERSPYELLIVFLRDILPSDRYELGQRLRIAISESLRSFSPDEPEYFDLFWDIVTISSRLRIESAKSELLFIMNMGLFRDKRSHNEDLHYCVIDALANLGMTPAETYCLRIRDIKDPRYSDVSYKAIYCADPGSWEKYLPEVIHSVSAEEDTDFLLVSILEDLVSFIEPECLLIALHNLFRSFRMHSVDTNQFVKALVEMILLDSQSWIPTLVEVLYKEHITSTYVDIQKDLNTTGKETIEMEGPGVFLIFQEPSLTAYVKQNQGRFFKEKNWDNDFKQVTLLALEQAKVESDMLERLSSN